MRNELCAGRKPRREPQNGTNYDFTFLNPDYEEVWEMLNAYYEDIV